MITIQPPETGNGAVAAAILRSLPDWFGIEEATQHYIDYVEAQPTFTAALDGQVVGFLALIEHSPYAAEIYVMAVLPEVHRMGVGRALVEAAEVDLRGRGFEFLQVKTLADLHPDEGYRKTRAFYHRMGFRDLEIFPELWGSANPCLQLIKTLRI